MKRFYGNSAERKLFFIRRYMNIITRNSTGTVNNGSTGFFSQIYVARNKIGMKMCFQYIFNSSIPAFCLIYIRLYLPKWVYNGNRSFRFNIVGTLSQASGI